MSASLRWDLLPTFMQVRKQPEFLGGEVYSLAKSIQVLDRKASLSVVSKVFGRLPTATAAEIDWEWLPHDELDGQGEGGVPNQLRSFLESSVEHDDRALVIWSAALCVELSTADLAEHIEDLMDATPDFAIYLSNAMTLIDHQFDGRVFVADLSAFV
jgi:hypothetical protein